MALVSLNRSLFGKDGGVYVTERTMYPAESILTQNTGTVVSTAFGTMTAITGSGSQGLNFNSGSSQTCFYNLQFARLVNTASVGEPIVEQWTLPSPAGRWRLADIAVRKTEGVGVSGDTMFVTGVNASGASPAVFTRDATASFDLFSIRNGVTSSVGSMLYPDRAFPVNLDSSTGDSIKIALAQATSGSCACEVNFKFTLLP